jgi:hypothetical protein
MVRDRVRMCARTSALISLYSAYRMERSFGVRKEQSFLHFEPFGHGP